MHSRTQEVLDYLDTTRSELSNAVEEVPAGRRDERPGVDRWSVAQVLEHLNMIEGRVAQMISVRIGKARAGGLGAELETSSVVDSISRTRIADRSQPANAPEMLLPPATIDAATVWSILQQSRADLRNAFVQGDGLALSEVKHEHPVLGLINLYQWLIFVGAHEVRHAEQIREIGQQLGG